MKFCPYCGADLLKENAAFCAESKNKTNTPSPGGISTMSRPETKRSITSPVKSSRHSKSAMIPRFLESWYSPGTIRKSWNATKSAFIPSTRVNRFPHTATIS